jgi:hypothetical protein
MNVLSFLARYGDHFLHAVRGAIELENSTHHVLFFRTGTPGGDLRTPEHGISSKR